MIMDKTFPLPQRGDAGLNRISADVRPLAEALRQLNVGQVRLGDHDRTLYATDASLYQVRPLGVVIPSNLRQIHTLVEFCRTHHVALLPRGGGTSLAGQCTNQALVLDFSPGFRAIRRIDPAAALCEVEPGLGIDELNRALAANSVNMFFAPDPATSAQAAIGGCIGNNAAGARSIRYGRTSENTAGVEVLLSTGEQIWLEAGAGRRHPVALRLAEQTADVVRRHAQEIRDRFPRLVRRNAGYGLDLVLAQLDRSVEAADLDLSGLICGSEGTLALVTAAKLKLTPLPAARGLAILTFASLDEAIAALEQILPTGPSAVELLDEVVLATAAGNTECRRYLDLIPAPAGQSSWGVTPHRGDSPGAVLYVEYEAERDAAELPARCAQLRRICPGASAAVYQDAASMNRAWTLRKAGEALLYGVPGARKPLTFVEDNAIAMKELSRFVHEFKRIVAAHGTTAAFYAHASVGVLHVRPLLDLHSPTDRQAMQSIAVQVAHLARDCGGVMSGEHGDGRARGPLLEEFFGPRIMEAFRRVKQIFDPAGILNPGFMVRPGAVSEITANLRIAAIRATDPPLNTYFDYADQENFRGAVEMCNGAGYCRKTAGGTMCPSYRATLEERHSPRGRANALRAGILGDAAGANWCDADTLATLDLCLSCKACKTECPSNVDIARLKAEYEAQGYRRRGHAPIAALLFGHVRALNRWGAMAPTIFNRAGRIRAFRILLNSLAGLAPQRPLPDFGPSLHRLRRRGTTTGETDRRPMVALFGDCFTAFGESHIGRDAIAVLETLGYAVQLPRTGCCGRAMISNGLLAQAGRTARRTLRELAGLAADPRVRAILVCEPSCLSAMLDDLPHLKALGNHAALAALTKKAMLVEDFIARFWDSHPRPPALVETNHSLVRGRPVLWHAHCHQKALWPEQIPIAIGMLRRLVGENLLPMDTGCCGMAGAFGYLRDHYDLSMRIFAAPEFDPLRQAPPEAIILANGTSCRQQMAHAAGRAALHPIQLAAQLLCRREVDHPVRIAAGR